MNESPERPLVTFALFAYNQEQFIREAVAGALAQDYEPLEIILSDDCSSDNTFQIMEGMARDYSGPNKVVLNRNQKNLGLGGHINAVMQIAQGELIVVAAGDDISLPQRASALTQSWLASAKKPDLLCSDYEKIDNKGMVIGEGIGCKIENMHLEKMAKYSHGVIGASAAWTKVLWQRFGNISNNLVYEDQVIPLRAAMLGGVHYVQEKLIQYRQNVSTWIPREKTDDQFEMQNRTLILNYNGIITTHMQIADAIIADRFDLICPIVKRLNTHRIVLLVYRKQLNPFAALVQGIQYGCWLKPIAKALVQVQYPWMHKVILIIRNR